MSRFVLVVALAVWLSACARGVLHPRAGVQTVAVQDDVSFVRSGNREIRVDVFKPALAGRRPAAILLHGSSGLHALAPNTVSRYARTLAEQGIITFVVHYFDGTGDWTADDSVETANYFQWVREVRDAVTWARLRSDVRPGRMGLVGHSLGAWLAVGVAAADPRISRMVLFGSGLEPFLRDSIRRLPPTLLVHGAQDDVVPLSDATALRDFMQSRKFRVNLRVYPGERHTFSDSAASDALTRAARFLSPARPAPPG